ncbi:hypothetical protein DCAR_0727634 [Daucus carota subsp. sativus]|uniref:Replication protein A OB domain-containing protein n=1 Tax=Daucus carota subsp. sativus TaxID=79200 RepID=A0A164T2K7_DAUCS|nr:hypothetical protein DCAR_0727634 [Daucus carota subsp. sativus]
MAEIPYQMISNLRPQTTTAWRLKVRVTRIWQAIDRQGETVGINLIFVDELLFVAEGVDYIQRHVFHFTDLSAIMDAARESNFLTDVVGILQQVQPISTYRNKYNQLKYSIQFTINDMHTSAQVIFYDEMAQSFDQEVHDAGQHPIIVIISSVKARLIQAIRFFINLNHEAVKDLRDALRLTNWRLH